MGKKISLLVDTDIFIDYLNHQLFKIIFTRNNYQIYYSAVTKKELLAKEGMNQSEERAIRKLLQKYRLVPLNQKILVQYSILRKEHPQIGKEDCLIAATAIVQNLPLATRNYKHYKVFANLVLYFSK